MQKFEKNALAASPSSDSSLRSPAKTAAWPFMTWAVAGAFVLLLFVFGTSWLFSGGPFGSNRNDGSVAVLRGNVTLCSADGKTANVGVGKEHGLVQDAGFTFDEKSGPVEMQFREGGNVCLTGLGEIQVQKDGFRVKKGEFDAKFKNLRGVMKVRVPGAVLGIRGTTIRFVIRPSLMMIQLIEGVADLIPDDVAAKPIQFTVGVFLRFSGKDWTVVQGNIPRDGLRHRPDSDHDGEYGKPESLAGLDGQIVASGTIPAQASASVTPEEGRDASSNTSVIETPPASDEPGTASATPEERGSISSNTSAIETPPASDSTLGGDDDLIGREGFQSN